MILKVQRENDEGWTYYDHLDSCEVYNSEEHKCVMVDISNSAHKCKLAIYSTAYLMNDNGKTLQVVHG